MTFNPITKLLSAVRWITRKWSTFWDLNPTSYQRNQTSSKELGSPRKKFYVSRTCTELDSESQGQLVSRPLEDFRSTEAFVLLGDPGSGKTTAFENERLAMGDLARYVSARDLINLPLANHQPHKEKTLFIDGLDEVRAGQSDARTPFDAVRNRIAELGSPKFRLSCRHADWLGENDEVNLIKVTPSGKLKVLKLDPLDESDTARILEAHPEVYDAEGFVREARERRMDGMLSNPQNLELLVDAVVGEGSWPAGRRETFEIAALKMVSEENAEHQIAQPAVPRDQLLDAAGRLCAIQLICGLAGYAPGRRTSDEEVVDPDLCGYKEPDHLRYALGTRLFVADGEEVLAPVHRHIAEFLGARHLARIIEEGLPAKRVISLITGEDGLVVGELRGISAWLASISSDARRFLIDLDPIGVGLYGDIRGFTTNEKQALMNALAAQSREFDAFHSASAFVELLDPEMVPVFGSVLTDDRRDAEHQTLATFLLRILEESRQPSELSQVALGMVRDESWEQHVRQCALDAYLRCCEDGVDKDRELQSLLTQIRDEQLVDTNNELLGALLWHMYPKGISEADVWDHLNDKGESNFIGLYLVFWKQRLVEQTSGERFPALMDGLAKRINRIRPILRKYSLGDVPFEILSRSLRISGDQMAIRHLFDWLSLEVALRRESAANGFRKEIRVWLENRPELQKSLVAEGLARCPKSDDFRMEAYYVLQRLFGAQRPSDFGVWCADQISGPLGDEPQVAEFLLDQAVASMSTEGDQAGLSKAYLGEIVAGREALAEKLTRLFNPTIPAWQRESEEQEQRLKEAEERRRRRWLETVRSHQDALVENSAPLGLLFELAKSYLGGIEWADDDAPGVRGIEESLEGDRCLVDAAIKGLSGAIYRPDIPDVDEVVQAKKNNGTLRVSFTVAAGMAEIERTTPDEFDSLDKDLLTKAIAHGFSAGNHQNWPVWYLRALRQHPDVVAEIHMKFATAGMQSDQGYVDGFWHLPHDGEHSQIARAVSLPLLESFPTKSSEKHMDLLENLLKSARDHAERETFGRLVRDRSEIEELDDAQRARWITLGLTIDPERFLTPAKSFVESSDSAILELAEAFRKLAIGELDLRVAEFIIEVVGLRVDVENSYKDGYYTPEMHAAQLVSSNIQALANSPAPEASDALLRLSAEPALGSWEAVISRAARSQLVIRRDASFRHPNVDEVRATLEGGTPANAGDLAASIVDRIEEIALRIRTANTDEWRQYWDEGKRGKLEKPKIEDRCRDTLLTQLRQLVPTGVDAQPEGQYANDKRSDIRVAMSSAFHVPVEIKKNDHDDLWTAIKDQLIDLYVIDPDTDGHGIYLVLWFGRDSTKSPPDGTRPEGPDELKEKLLATLSPEERRKITVCVVDVSPTDA